MAAEIVTVEGEHDVRHDRAGFGEHVRLTCYSKPCGGATLLAQPWMGQDDFEPLLAAFMAEHPATVVPSADRGGRALTYDPAANAFTRSD